MGKLFTVRLVTRFSLRYSNHNANDRTVTWFLKELRHRKHRVFIMSHLSSQQHISVDENVGIVTILCLILFYLPLLGTLSDRVSGWHAYLRVTNMAHYVDVIMTTIASQITSLTIVYSTFCSGADQRKHQSSASLAFVQGIHRGPVNSPHKGPVTRKMFPFDDVIMGQGAVTTHYIPSESYLKFKSRDISFAHHLFLSYIIVSKFCTEHGIYSAVHWSFE